MGNEIFNIKSNEGLLNALKYASTAVSTSAQILEQRASYIYGSMKPDSSISKERIKEVLAQQQGGKGAAE